MSEIDYIIAPRIPRGLAPAVEGLAREILRQRPRNIYAFAAQHFAELVELRDKERTDEIVPRILKHKLVNDRDVENRNDYFRRCKYGNLIEEAMVIRKVKELTTARNATKKAVASKRKGETTNKSGWSINRMVKGLKKHENTIGRKGWNRGLNANETEKPIPGYSDHRSPRFSSQVTCHQFVRSSSAGNIFAKRIKRREVKENHEQFYTFVLDDKSYKNVKKVMRQKSADQIERNRTYFKDTCTSEDVDIDIVSTEARICRNLKDQWKTMIEDERKEQEKFQEKFGNTKGGDAKLNSRLGKKSERESKDNEVEEMFINVRSRSDSSESNIIFEDAMKKLTNDGAISVVLPSVVTRQPPVKCTRNNVYECNGKDSTGNLTLPPISSDGSKSTKRGSNLIGLPSLLNEVDVRLNEQTICQDYEDPTNSNWNPKDLESEKELKPTGTIEGTTFDYDSKTIEKERKDEDLKGGNVNVDMVPWKYPRGSKSEGNGILVMTGNTMEEGIDKQQILGEVEIIQQCLCSSREADIEETFKDSLNVTPDSIDLSHCQRADSLEHLENGKEEEEDQDQDEEKKEEEERYRLNELKRKLIEIETVERSIENTLAYSQTIPKDIDVEFVVSKNSNKFSTLKNFESEKSDCDERQVLSVGDKWTKKNPDKSQSSTSNEDDRDCDANIAIDSMEDEMPIGKSLDSNLDSDNSEIFINGNNNSDNRDTRDHSTKERGIDISCYVLTEGSPSEIPETVTTVIIPDNIVDNDSDVCKIELEEGTNDEICIPFNEPVSSWNIERKQMKRGIEEEYCHDENPFGEYIHPESTVDYTTNIDTHILRGIKNAANRASVYQEDLANIKEEEENDRGKFSNVDVQRSIDDRISIFSKKSAESMENKNSIECEAKFASSSQEEDQERNNMDDKDDARSKDLSKEIPRKRREEESETFDDRSSDFSLSFEQVGAGPKVPELNLDSLQDITISSTIEKGNSKNLNNQSEEENDNVTSCEDENDSLSSFDTLASEEKVDIGEALSSENDRVKVFIEPVGQQTKVESKTERYSKEEFQGNECTNNTSCSLVRNKDKKQSLRVEEEIARELIQNFIIDNTDVAEKDAKTIPFEMDDLMASSSSKHQTNNTNQTDDFMIKFHLSIQELTPEAIIEKSSRREKIDDDNNQAGDENEEDERRSGGSGETAREDDGGNEASILLPSLHFFFFLF